jgi:hypothetical protein
MDVGWYQKLTDSYLAGGPAIAYNSTSSKSVVSVNYLWGTTIGKYVRNGSLIDSDTSGKVGSMKTTSTFIKSIFIKEKIWAATTTNLNYKF